VRRTPFFGRGFTDLDAANERSTMTDTATNRQQYQEKIGRIRRNPDLNQDAKRRMIREIHEEAAKEHNRRVTEAWEAREEAVRSAERKVFAISYPERATASEKAMIALSYRDARDRAEHAAADRENQDALEDLLDRAQKSGDTQLAEATYHVATLRGARRVADAYLAERSTARRRWEVYVEARQEADPRNLGVLASVVGPQRPPELGG
jgi:hypothetical protein